MRLISFKRSLFSVVQPDYDVYVGDDFVGIMDIDIIKNIKILYTTIGAATLSDPLFQDLADDIDSSLIIPIEYNEAVALLKIICHVATLHP